MDLDDVKACLVGLLSSTIFAYNLKSLLKDFEEISGCSLPLFGHQNSIEFLQSLSDTLKLSGDILNPEVHLVASKKSAHIVSLLDRQKIPSKLLKQHLRRRVVLQNSDDDGSRKDSKLQGKNNAIKTSEDNKTATNGGKLPKIKAPKSNLNGENRRITMNENRNYNKIEISVENDIFEKNPADNRLQELNLQPTENFKSSSFSDVSNTVNDNFKNKLKDLIKEHDNGIWCCDLPKLFFQKFKYDLNFKEFGYTSLINMLSDLPDIFRCLRPGQDDWILFNASAPPSQVEKFLLEFNSKEKTFKDAQKALKSIFSFTEIFQNENIDLDSMPALVSENEQSNYVFPNDVMGPQDTMADIVLKDHILLGKRINIYAAEVWSPSLFYIHLEKFSVDFKRFMCDLQQFYDTHICEYKMPDFVIKPKQICAGLYASDPQNPEEWHRVEILDIISEKMVIVNFVDFGTEAVMKKNKLRFLHRAFQFFPIQGIAASLAGITPFDGKKDWSVSASAKLFDLMYSSKLQADVVNIDYRDKPILNLIIYHSNNLSGPSLNKQLVDEKLAKNKDTILISRDKSYEKFIETNNVASNLVNSTKSAVENPLHLEFAGKETSKNMESKSLNKIGDDKNKVGSDINKKDYSLNELKKKELISENKAAPEAVAKKCGLFDLDEEDVYLSSGQTVQQKSSNHDYTSTENSYGKIVNEGIQINNNYNGSKLEKTDSSSLAAAYSNFPPGLEANKNRILELKLFQYLLLQKKEYSVKIRNIILQFLYSNPLLKDIAVNNPDSVLNIVTEMSETFLSKFSRDTITSKISNSTQVSCCRNFNDFFLPPLNFEFLSDNFKNIFSVSPSQNISNLDIFNINKINVASPATAEVEASSSPVSCVINLASPKNQFCSVETPFYKMSSTSGRKTEKNLHFFKPSFDREEETKIVTPEELQTALPAPACGKKTSSTSLPPHKSRFKSKLPIATSKRNSAVSVDSKTNVTKDVSVKVSANMSSRNSKNVKYDKEEKN